MADGRWTIRTRLAAIYGLTVLLAGSALLGITLLLFERVLTNRPVNTSIVVAHQSTQPSPATDPGTQGQAIGTAIRPSTPPTEDDASFRLAEELHADFRRSALRDLIGQGSLALAVLVVVGAWLGWLVAGRTVGPIKQMTATVRRVGDGSLHERAALPGPRDEMHELADSFNDMLSRLDSAFDRQRRFVANASHELKTPLTISRTLIEVSVTDPAVREPLLEVNLRQERIINGLLQLARSDQGLVDRAPLDLAQLTAHVIEGITPTANVRLFSQLVPTPLQGNAVLLEQLVQNLLHNAVQYNEENGSVWVHCAPFSGEARLRVENTGPVVSPAGAAQVFEPFLRLGERSGSGDGSGLGLSIVRSIARAHGGDGSAIARRGGGLVVTICFPAASRQDES